MLWSMADDGRTLFHHTIMMCQFLVILVVVEIITIARAHSFIMKGVSGVESDVTGSMYV